MLTTLLIALLMLSLSFFFSGVEIAFLSVSRISIELRLKEGSAAAKVLSAFKEKESRVLTTILVGNNLALVVFTMMVEKGLGPTLGELGVDESHNFFLYTTILAIVGTLVVLIFAEFIPKAIFKAATNKIIFPSAYFLRFFFYLLWGPVWLVSTLAWGILWIFRIRPQSAKRGLGRDDLGRYLRQLLVEGEGDEGQEMTEIDTERLHNALEFRDTKAREMMIPRIDIDAISIESSVEELMEEFIQTAHSRLIVYEENLDDIKGFVHTSCMFDAPSSVKKVVQEVLIVPESMSASVLLSEFNEQKKTIAIVVDENGGTEGLITIEDLVEEVFGEIEDEYDKQETEEDELKHKNPDGSLLLGARLELDDIKEEFELKLPEDDQYTTLGGLFIHLAEEIPKTNASIELGIYKLTAVKTTSTKIIQIKIEKTPENKDFIKKIDH